MTKNFFLCYRYFESMYEYKDHSVSCGSVCFDYALELYWMVVRGDGKTKINKVQSFYIYDCILYLKKAYI